MESNALMFVDITKEYHASNFSGGFYFSPPPHHFRPPPRPPYHNTSYYKASALTVLCLGTLALIIICWKWCTNRSKKGTGGAAQTTTPAPEENLSYEPADGSYMPKPPPYTASEFDKPPPYTILDSTNYVPQVGPSLPKYVKYPETDGGNRGQTSQTLQTTPITTLTTPNRDHVVNIRDPKT